MDKYELDTRLWKAAEKGNVEEIKALLAQGADVNAVRSLGKSALMAAARNGHAAAMQCLLEHGADARYKSEGCFTPLWNAIYSRRIDAVRLLLEHGAEVNVATANGMNALDYAIKLEFTEAVECLREHGAGSRQMPQKQPTAGDGATDAHIPDAQQTQGEHKTADNAKLDAILAQYTLDKQLWDAAEKGNVEEIRALLAQGANVDAVDTLGASALMAAALKGHLAAMRCLLEHGADASYKDEEWHTPLMCAIHSGDIAAVRLLLEHGAEVNAATAHGTTALELAGIFKFTEAVECLLKHGADPNAAQAARAKGREAPSPEHGADLGSRQMPHKQPAADNDSAGSRAFLKRYLPGIITCAVAPFLLPLGKTFLFFLAGVITNAVLPRLPRLALRHGLIDSDYAYTPVVSMATVLIIKALLVVEALCGVAALVIAIHARASKIPLPASFDFFIGFFLAGVVLLIRYRGLFS